MDERLWSFCHHASYGEIEIQNSLFLAEKMRKLIEIGPFDFDDKKIKVTASFGVTLLGGGETFPTAIARADELLYRAKQGGRNCVVGDNLSVVVPLRPLRTALS